ncbi:hypothetical protein [Cryobacterium tagatosivorans]|uniref:TetR/AcrR family transcriptional regulator n=1 Tax=Cryobacterium tagatosivorans TaxID=1259199 RepID=UPI001F547295|nr:hypothetical protein [Cryobacterium tagatosivorans]
MDETCWLTTDERAAWVRFVAVLAHHVKIDVLHDHLLVVNDTASGQLRDFIQSRLLVGTRDRHDPDAVLRAGLASSMLVGIVTGRRIIGVPTLVAADTETLVAVIGPAIQQILVPTAAAAHLSTGPRRSQDSEGRQL